MDKNHNLIITDSASKRVFSERIEHRNDNLYLRITVEGGGCSGFQYNLDWDNKINKEEDHVFEEVIVIDNISLEIMNNSTIDYITNFMGSDFKISNPNAKSGCGCGNSFST